MKGLSEPLNAFGARPSRRFIVASSNVCRAMLGFWGFSHHQLRHNSRGQPLAGLEFHLLMHAPTVAYCLEMSEPAPPSTTPDSSRWETSITNEVPALMHAVEEMDHFLQRYGADAKARYLAQLAVEELGTNIIKYGYDDQNTHTISIRAVFDEQSFQICLEDDGHEFNPCKPPETDPHLSLEVRNPGGWGISLVQRLVGGMEYKRHGNRNVVCVIVPRLAAPNP